MYVQNNRRAFARTAHNSRWQLGQAVTERKYYSSSTLKNSSSSPCRVEVKPLQACERGDGVNVHRWFWKTSLRGVTWRYLHFRKIRGSNAEEKLAGKPERGSKITVWGVLVTFLNNWVLFLEYEFGWGWELYVSDYTEGKEGREKRWPLAGVLTLKRSGAHEGWRTYRS